MKQEQYLEFLSHEARQIFDELTHHLKRNNIHQEADYFSLAALANSYSVYRNASKQLNKDGLLNKTKTGYVTASPLHQIMKVEQANIQKLSAAFLLDPASRQRLFRGKLMNDKKRVDPTEGLD